MPIQSLHYNQKLPCPNINLKRKLNTPTQFGFTAGQNSHIPVTILLNHIAEMNLSSRETHIVYIDFSQMFDSIQHWSISDCLTSMNFPLKLTTIILATLTQNVSYATTPYGLSPPFPT